MNQIIVGFFKNKMIKRIMLQSCITLLLGMIMMFSMPTDVKSADSNKPLVPLIEIRKVYTENMTYDSSKQEYKAAGASNQLIKLYMLASDGTWSDDQIALLKAGGARINFTTEAYTPGGFVWSWYAPYVELQKWVNQMEYHLPTSTTAPEKTVRMNWLSTNLNFYENKRMWVNRTVDASIPASTFIDDIKGNVIQPPNYHSAWGSDDYGWHDTNIFRNNRLVIYFPSNIQHPTIVVYKPSATTIISGQTLANSSLYSGSVMSETAYYTPMPYKPGISGTFKWQNPSQQITNNTTVKAEFDPVYANFAKPDLMDIPVTVRPAVVTLDKNGGTGGSASAEGWFNSTLADTTIPTKTGYDFKGYFSAPTGGTQYYNSSGVGVKNWDIAADTTLYAQWEESISVSDISAPSPILTGTKLSLTYPTVIGTTTGKGWQYSADGTTNWKGFNPIGETLSASQNEYYIRYFATNGTYTAYSNSVQITVYKYESELIIEADKTSTSYPGNILLTATLSGVNDFTGKKVYFYDVGNFLGERFVDSSGKATLLLTKPTVGVHAYSVSFDEDSDNSRVHSDITIVTVSKGTQAAVNFESTADINKTYGAANFTLPTVSGGSGTGAYIYRSDNSEVATLSGNTVSIRGAGVANIYVKRNGDANYNDSAETVVKVIVAPKAVTIGGIIAYDKVYDGNDNAEIGTGSPSLVGIINFDDVQIDYTNTLAKFADHNAASSISVSFSGFALKGTKASNYVLTDQPAGVYAEIYQREIKISGISAKHKIYDGAQTAVLDLGNVVFNNIIDGDSLTLSATGTFEDANAGDDKIVYIENIELGGTSVDNYYISSGFKREMILTQTTATASIIPKAIVITPDSGQSKNYGQADGILTFTHTDPIIEETAVFTGYLGRTAGEKVGTYPINLGTLSLADNGAFKAANYIIELSGASVDYTIKSVIATADDYTVTGNKDGWNNQDLIITPRLGGYNRISTDETYWNHSIILSDEGNPSTVEFYLKHFDGTTTEKVTYTYMLDKTAPTATISQNENSWTKFLNNITFGLFFKDTKTVTISGADVDGSGIASIGYYILEVDDNKVDLTTTLDQAKAYTYTEGTEFNISPDKNIVVFAKIVDNAGNVTYINSQGMVFDETAPVISGITNGQTYYTTRELVVTDTNLDSITINGDKLIGNTVPGDVDMTYVVVGTDKAGNSTTYTITMKSINSLATAIDSLYEKNVKSSDKGAIETVKANVANISTDTATEAEKDKLQGITDKCDTLLTKISNIDNEIEAVNTKLGDTTKTNGKSSDSVRLGEVKIELERLLATDNLTEEERTNLEGTLKVTNEAITEIAKVATEISEVVTKLGDTTKTNGKSSDSVRLGEVKIELERLLATDNLTEEERTNLEGTLKVTNEAIAEIAKVATEISEVVTKLGDTTKTNGKSSDSVRLGEVKIELERLLATDNLTEEERTNLEGTLKVTNEAIAEIAKVATEISEVVTKIGDTTSANGKSSDSVRLGEVKVELERLLATDNLTDGEKANLEKKLAITNEAIAKIDEVKKAIANALAPISNITQNNVTKKDGSKVDKGIKDLQKILADYANNLTDTEKAMINTQIKKIQEIRKVLDEVKAVEDLIIALPSDIEKVRDSFNKLSAHQQKLIDSTLIAKLDEFLNPKMKSVIIDSATGIKIEGINGTLFNPRTILVLTPIIDTQGFAGLDENQEMLQLYDIKFLLDGKEIQPEGNIKITLKLTQEQQDYKDLKVVYIAEDGTVTIIPSEVNGDEVSFITDHFSHYGIIGTRVISSDTSATPGKLEIINYIILGVMSVAAITVIIIMKKSSDNKKQKK